MHPSSRRPDGHEISAAKLSGAYQILRKAVDDRKIMGCAVQVSQNGVALEPEAFGRRSTVEDLPVEKDTIFLTASVTKPVTATCAMILVDKGRIGLDEPVSSLVPEFGDGGMRNRILVRHLLSHTSGLPDQLPENRELRASHAPLQEFIRRTYRTPLLFEPGSSFSYSSSGMTMLMDIVQRVTGLSLADFARRDVFGPLGMKDTSYGVDWSKAGRVSQVNIPSTGFQYGEADAVSWNWNSPYWWSLGSPWGGMVSTVGDLTRFLSMFMDGGRSGTGHLLSPSTVSAMLANQTGTLSSISKKSLDNPPWGFGWQLKARNDSFFGDMTSSQTFGHRGATGTLVWADPGASLTCAILTNQPFDDDVGSHAALLRRFSDAVIGSL
jgi:CubicO group peptidase (beta-lactamase class C family)